MSSFLLMETLCGASTASSWFGACGWRGEHAEHTINEHTPARLPPHFCHYFPSLLCGSRTSPRESMMGSGSGPKKEFSVGCM